MNNLLVDLIDRVDEQVGVDGVETVLGDYLSKFGFEAFTYMLIPKEFEFEFAPVILSNMPDDWLRHYSDNNYAEHDWTIEHCVTRLNPAYLDLDNLPDSVTSDKNKLKVMEDCRQVLQRGFAFPFRAERLNGGAGVYTNMSARDFESVRSEYEETINLGISYAHYALVDLGYSSSDEAINLSRKERDVLLFKIQGLTSKQIAQKMHIAEVTVNFHWQNVAKKLKVETAKEVIPKALSYGLVR